jgi:hypothetical protein
MGRDRRSTSGMPPLATIFVGYLRLWKGLLRMTRRHSTIAVARKPAEEQP